MATEELVVIQDVDDLEKVGLRVVPVDFDVVNEIQNHGQKGRIASPPLVLR